MPNGSHQGMSIQEIVLRMGSIKGSRARSPTNEPTIPQARAWVSTTFWMYQRRAPMALRVANSSRFSMVVA